MSAHDDIAALEIPGPQVTTASEDSDSAERCDEAARSATLRAMIRERRETLIESVVETTLLAGGVLTDRIAAWWKVYFELTRAWAPRNAPKSPQARAAVTPAPTHPVARRPRSHPRLRDRAGQ